MVWNHSYTKCATWCKRNKNKDKLLKIERQKYQNKRIRQLSMRNESRFHYKPLQDIINVKHNEHNHMQSIIKPKIAINYD